MRTKKILMTLALMLLVFTPSINALDWHEQRFIAKVIGNSYDYEGSFRFVYYSDYQDYQGFYRYSDKSHLITFYKSSLELSKEQFVWLVLHELGHYDEKVNVCKRDCPRWLNESYADDWADKEFDKWKV